MKRTILKHLLAVALLATAFSGEAAESTVPIVASDLVFDEVDGIVAVEAEHFYKQTLNDKRAWHITSSKGAPDVEPDADPPHVAGASGSGYYVWVRSFSTGREDNGVHVGLNGQWPESGQRWQTVQKQKWAWDCKQRTADVHTGVPMQLFLDIEKAGEHEILFSMREDGFEMDKFVLASNKEFKPEGKGPAVKVKAGRFPAPFPEVAESAPAPKKFPAHWGEPPAP